VLVNAEGEMVPAVVTALDFDLPASSKPDHPEGAAP
jgi:hypothetical protein